MSTIEVLKRMLKRMRAGTLPDESDLNELEGALRKIESGIPLPEAFGVAPRKVGRPRKSIWRGRMLAVEVEIHRKQNIEDAVAAVVSARKDAISFETLHKIYKDHRGYARWHVAEDGGPITADRHRALEAAYGEYVEDLALENSSAIEEGWRIDATEEFKPR